MVFKFLKGCTTGGGGREGEYVTETICVPQSLHCLLPDPLQKKCADPFINGLTVNILNIRLTLVFFYPARHYA